MGLSRRFLFKCFLPVAAISYGAAAFSNNEVKKSLHIDLKKIKEISPEMFGAVGDGITDDYESLQAALKFWVAHPGKQFVGNGTYAVSSPIFVISPGYGSKFYVHGLKKHKAWKKTEQQLFKRKDSILVLDIEDGKGSNTWGAYFEVGSIVDDSIKNTPNDYYVFGIANNGWQQCEIIIGLSQGFISAINIRNKKQTTPTVQYKIRMARNNLINYFANNDVPYMYEGCVFETNWTSGGLFGAEILGDGSTYAKIHGGSADFSGDHLMYVKTDKIPKIKTIGHEVRLFSGVFIGWYLGIRYHPESSDKSIIIACPMRVASNNGKSERLTVSIDDEIIIDNIRLNIKDISVSNNSHSVDRFLPTAICIASEKQKIVRWRVDRDYDSGVIFPNDVYYADSQVNTSNAAVRRKLPLPLGCNFDSGITDGKLILNGGRYATRLHIENLAIVSPGGISTSQHSSVWKLSGNSKQSILASDNKSTDIIAFTLSTLGGGTITGRISSRDQDPATDEIGLWEITGFGTNINGTVAIDKWDVLWNGGDRFFITKSISGTHMQLSTSHDASGKPSISLSGGISTSQARSGESWQYRMTALRKFTL